MTGSNDGSSGDRFHEMPKRVGDAFLVWHSSKYIESVADRAYVAKRLADASDVQNFRSVLKGNYTTLKTLKPGNLTFSLVNSALNLKASDQPISQFIGWSIEGYLLRSAYRNMATGAGGPVGLAVGVALLLGDVITVVYRRQLAKETKEFAERIRADSDHVLDSYTSMFIAMEKHVDAINSLSASIWSDSEATLKTIKQWEKKLRPHLGGVERSHKGRQMIETLFAKALDQYFETALADIIRVEKMSAVLYPVLHAFAQQAKAAADKPHSNLAAGFPEYDKIVQQGDGQLKLEQRKNTFPVLAKRFQSLLGKTHYCIFLVDWIFQEAYNNRQKYRKEWGIR